jgi:hypothetical protein
MKQFEYYTLPCSTILNSSSPEIYLNDLGNRGWELVTVCLSGQECRKTNTMIFKREINPEYDVVMNKIFEAGI